MSKQQPQPIDPDIWGALNLVVSTVAMFAQLAALKAPAPPKGLGQHSSSVAYEKIRDELETAIRNCEKLVRVLSDASGDSGNPLEAVFGFGTSRTFFPPSSFQRYGELVSQIGLNAGAINLWTLSLIKHDPGFAAQIGDAIMTETNNVQLRINNLFTKQRTNQEVLDECLLMLRSFSRLLGGLDRHRN